MFDDLKPPVKLVRLLDKVIDLDHDHIVLKFQFSRTGFQAEEASPSSGEKVFIKENQES